MEKEIEIFVNNIIAPNAKRIIESGKEHTPMVFLKTKDAYGLIKPQFKKHKDKLFFLKILKMTLKEFDSPYYILVCEAWAITRKKVSKKTPKPSKAKDRKEVLEVLVNMRDGHTISYMADIITKDKKRKLAELRKIKSNKTGGLFKIEW